MKWRVIDIFEKDLERNDKEKMELGRKMSKFEEELNINNALNMELTAKNNSFEEESENLFFIQNYRSNGTQLRFT